LAAKFSRSWRLAEQFVLDGAACPNMPSDYAVSIPCLTECSAPFAAQSSSVISAVVLLVAGVFNLYQEFTSPEDDYKFMAMYQLCELPIVHVLL
jgi:hypothetical protein